MLAVYARGYRYGKKTSLKLVSTYWVFSSEKPEIMIVIMIGSQTTMIIKYLKTLCVTYKDKNIAWNVRNLIFVGIYLLTEKSHVAGRLRKPSNNKFKSK